ncbi:MAG: hypothetical protein EKK53_25185 [Burkholderiales bacterium]|nr:MAG: hypothetical protein EKK53_25185 [Burkholderiales bacterium]
MLGVTDEDLMAWVDGELPAAEADRVAAAVATDDALAARAARLRHLNQQLRQAFATDLAEPVPAALAALARGEPASTSAGSATVHPLTPRRRKLGWAAWGGIAAGVLLTVAVAPRLAPWSSGTEPSVQAQADGRLLARGALGDALEHGLAGAPRADGTRLLLSFRDRSGQFCRSFAAPVGRGLACRDNGRWQVVVLTAPATAAAPVSGDQLRLASGDLPTAVLGAVEQRIAGLALDAAEERRARDAGWAP